MDTALQAKQNQQWSASNRLLELLGKELGMFNRPEFVWNGDLALFPISSSSGLPNNLKRSGENRAALERDKRRALIEAGLSVDIELETTSRLRLAAPMPPED